MIKTENKGKGKEITDKRLTTEISNGDNIRQK